MEWLPWLLKQHHSVKHWLCWRRFHGLFIWMHVCVQQYSVTTHHVTSQNVFYVIINEIPGVVIYHEFLWYKGSHCYTIALPYHKDNVYTLNKIEQPINNKIAWVKTNNKYVVDQLGRTCSLDLVEGLHETAGTRPQVEYDPTTKSNSHVLPS